MKMEITVTDVRELINKIRQEPGVLFDMIRVNVQETVGQYMSALMDSELTQFLGRDRYERSEGESNHRNGSYPRDFTLKGIGEVGVKVPRDRNGEFSTQVIPRNIQYEDAIREDLCTMFPVDVSTRTLSMMSERLIGRSISATEVSESSKELTRAVEEWICLRTTNVIERLNKEFKRRTKPVEIVAGERSCYTLLAFVCLKMAVR